MSVSETPASLGARVIHAQTTAELIPTMPAPDLTAYEQNLVSTDETQLAGLLRARAPAAVVPGPVPGSGPRTT